MFVCVCFKCEQVDFEEASASFKTVLKFICIAHQRAKSTWALIMIGLNVVVVYGAAGTPLIPSIDGLLLLQP